MSIIEPAGRTRRDLLLSPVLATCLAVLVLNDHVLKGRWPGLLTGKLSDVAGVAMVAIVLTAVTRRPLPAMLATAAGFALLKSSDAVADAAAPVLGGVTRTDPTDLAALLVLGPLGAWLVRPPQIGAGRSRWALPLQAITLGGIALATSATSCATNEVYSVQGVGGVVVAATDDGTFESLDGGRTWRVAADVPFDTTSDSRRRSVCLDDGRCFEISDTAVVLTTVDGPVTDFELSAQEAATLAEANPNDCGPTTTRFGSIAAVELADGAHVVVSVGPHGALHRSPDGVWEWTIIADYGRSNPLAGSADGSGGSEGRGGSGGGGNAVSPTIGVLALATPIALALTAVPLGRTARRNRRSGWSGSLPVLIAATVLLAASPTVFVLGALGGGAAPTVTVALTIAAAIAVFATTAFAVSRPAARRHLGGVPNWPPPSPT